MKFTYIKNIAFSTLVSMCLFSQTSVAQSGVAQGSFGYYQDAIRFSQNRFGSSARIQGIGNAATAIGGDISSAAINPAGLGYLQRSEISFSPAFSLLGSTSTYNLENAAFPTDEAKLNFNIAQFGGAFVLPSKNTSGYKGGAFAITYTRQNSFHSNVSYEGTNSQNSIIDYFIEQANGVSWNSIDTGDDPLNLIDAAYRTYLINPDFDFDNGTQDTYYSFVPIAPTLQREVIEYKGAQSQWNISYGGNFSDKLFFGASLGIQSFDYTETKRYSETVTDTPLDPNAPNALRDLTMSENLNISGTGINFTAGAIFRPIYPIRLGASVTTPTYFAVTDTYDASIIARYNNYNFGNDENGNSIILNEEKGITPSLESTYNMTTPLRASVGAAFFIGKLGFISADVDFINYSSTKLLNAPSSDFSFNADNQTIKNLYASSMNYRIGAEARFNDFYLRGGYGLYGNVVNEEFRTEDEKAFQSVLSAGLGIHKKNFYLDFAFTHQINQNEYTPYTLSNNTNPTVNIENRATNLVATLGFHF